MEPRPSPNAPPEGSTGSESASGCAAGDCPTQFPEAPRREDEPTEPPFVGAAPGSLFSPGEAVNEHEKEQSGVKE
jgi:hypothetical protein